MKNSRLLLKRFLNACKVGFFLSAITCLTSTCSVAAPAAKTGLALGTVCSVNAYEDGSTELYSEIFSALEDIEQKMSLTIIDSEINSVNAHSGISEVKVSSELFYVVSKALEFAKLSEGAFDPTIGAITSLWNIGKENERIPLPKEISDALPLVNWKDVLLDEKEKSIFLLKKGMKLDLGGIAKGYATDVAVELLQKYNVKRAIIDFGGNIYAYGHKDKKSGTSWTIGIKNPLQEKSDYARFPLKVFANDKAVVTSGPYERFFEQNGLQYHHILNPKTGYPTENDIASVTILSDSALIADAFSTACFVLGKERAITFFEKEVESEIIIIDTKKNIYLTSNPADTELMDSSFTIKNSIPAGDN